MITCSSAKFGAKMERDSSLRSLSLQQQNFCKVPQLEKKFKISSNFSMVFSRTLMEMVTVKIVTAASGPKWNCLL
jgi:hypothetical protein